MTEPPALKQVLENIDHLEDVPYSVQYTAGFYLGLYETEDQRSAFMGLNQEQRTQVLRGCINEKSKKGELNVPTPPPNQIPQAPAGIPAPHMGAAPGVFKGPPTLPGVAPLASPGQPAAAPPRSIPGLPNVPGLEKVSMPRVAQPAAPIEQPAPPPRQPAVETPYVSAEHVVENLKTILAEVQNLRSAVKEELKPHVSTANAIQQHLQNLNNMVTDLSLIVRLLFTVTMQDKLAGNPDLSEFYTQVQNFLAKAPDGSQSPTDQMIEYLLQPPTGK